MSAIRVARVRRALAAWIATNVDAVWSETDPYGPTDRAITLRDLPSQPDTAVAVEVYSTTDGIVLPDTEVRVQLMFRGRGDGADEFGDDVFDALHGRRLVRMGDLLVQQAHRVSSAPLGPDDNARERRADNYELVFKRTL